MKANRIFFLLVALQISFAARAENLASIFTNAPLRAVPAHRPSIIFLQFHGLAAGDLSCYGQTNFQTPNFDRLAAEGIRFKNYSPGDTNISSAQTILMTGKFSPENETVAQLLKNSGYRTGLIGEWTLPAPPWTQGFDEFAGFLSADEGTNYFADYLWRYATGEWINPTNNQRETFSGREMIYENTGGKKGKYLPELFFNAALNFIRVNQPDQFNKFRPFFLLVNLPAPRTATVGADDFPVPSDAPFSDEPWPQAAKNRAALITRLDGDIGKLFDQLQKFHMTNNVVIFLTSESGPEKFANANLNFLRLDSDFHGGHAPMILRWPEKISGGRVSDLNFGARDFFPTAAEIASVKLTQKMDGNSILPNLFSETKTNSPAQK
jgi:arylsulfatase A-like enzyme